jgi:acetyl-CoA carboxylase biotin carboxylase subunit
MIRRLLIANRGEIAVRIIKACREMAIDSVAVYSEADADAPHVAAADRAVAIGPAPAVESYLSIERVLDAVRTSGADAVHPGYGFLSENAAFAGACEKAGVVFVGPPARAIERMGSKIEARRLAESAGVPVVPGETPDDQSDAGLRRAIDRVRLPVLVKASAGGGGKGMRVVRDAAEIADAVRAARREAAAAFGDGTLYVERLIDRPRHVEVQIFADSHGHATHVCERECSVQRRHQKVIEESPSPALTPRLRARMAEAAVKAARAADYTNAGTVEFLLDGTGDDARFYFLEMNTRLQVEHGVTEAVAGVDLVHAQILVASGEPLPWREGALVQRGHAIEARVYAEDPAHGFLPQAGRLLLYREPRIPGIRIDAGVVEGGSVTVHYDPMLAKVIALAETRALAIERLAAALRAYPILGIRTNIPFLLRILEHPRFQAGQIDTGFLDREGAALAEIAEPEPPAFVRDAVAAAAGHQSPATRYQPLSGGHQASVDPWTSLAAWGR